MNSILYDGLLNLDSGVSNTDYTATWSAKLRLLEIGLMKGTTVPEQELSIVDSS